MSARLVIADSAYTLLEGGEDQWREIATLRTGWTVLLPSSRPIDERALEAGIEAAEDWLMPHAPRLRARDLEVVDATGRLEAGLHDILSVSTREWSVKDVEDFFSRIVDMATGSRPSSVQELHAFAADILLLRELAHHGQVLRVRLA